MHLFTVCSSHPHLTCATLCCAAAFLGLMQLRPQCDVAPVLVASCVAAVEWFSCAGTPALQCLVSSCLAVVLHMYTYICTCTCMYSTWILCIQSCWHTFTVLSLALSSSPRPRKPVLVEGQRKWQASRCGTFGGLLLDDYLRCCQICGNCV